MFNKLRVLLLSAILFLGLSHLTAQAAVQAPEKVQTSTEKISPAVPVYVEAKSLDIVNNPSAYLNKRVKVVAIFDKFSTLGLDYKPAFRSSEDYISFLIKRDDVINNTVPLSEMKIFIKRDEAEKYIELNSGDIVEFDGLVFSDALSDAWVEVENFKVVKSKEKVSD